MHTAPLAQALVPWGLITAQAVRASTFSQGRNMRVLRAVTCEKTCW